MYLKEIEISGFKSFADKININLNNETTCIVGPNGSGKSNIVDAIRFVLGEQSVKSLRGDTSMSDVIFGGSKNRSPMHVASVTLTFDNSDNYLNVPYTTVSVKRRLYKTGDNEYFLNGEKCRLKDITDLLLDSSVGKNSFNIIGQGEISKIISNSSYDRRIVIEEAAGILKYKKRREEAFKKLDKTNLNLDRVNDIIGEVEGRVEPLRKQSEKALKYLDTKKELEKVEVALLTEEITSMNLEYQDIKSKTKTINDNLIKLNKELTNPEIDNLKLKEINISKELQEKNNNLVKITKEKEEINTKRLILKERVKYDSNDIKVQENINYLKENKLSLENKVKLLNKDLENFTIKKKEFEDTLNRLIDEEDNLKLRRENNLKEYNYKTKEMYNLENRIEVLKSNLSDNVYLNNNTRSILDNPRLVGVHDALLNIVKTKKEFEKALDVIMNPIKNFLIVDNGRVANDAIDYLKSNKLGRATFLPLDVIKGRMVDLDTLVLLKSTNGYLGILSDFLEYQGVYKDIVLNQFGNIIVVDNLENGNSISKLIKNRYRVVTLDGDIIHVGGSITGGSIDTSRSLTGVRNEISDLEVKAKLNKNILENLEKEIKEIEDSINDYDKNIYNNRTNLIRTLDEMNEINLNLSNSKKSLEDVTLELKTLGGEEKEEEKELDKIYYAKTLLCDELEKDIKNLVKEKEELQGVILEKEGINKVKLGEKNKYEKELNSLEITENNLNTKLDNNLNILNSEYSLTYERAREEYSLDIPIEDAKNKVDELRSTIKEIGMVNLDAIDEYKEINERYTYLSSERDDLLHAKDMLYSIIDEMDEVMQSDFLNTFKELEVEFKKVFKEMFKGGDATLSLTDPNNLLETGVDIIASPPGKKLKTIQALSGGEMTLTAISLLFAILNIRSVPFCIFDEVEAALDEANVDVFGTYLDHYKDKTQFLLITHKKRTMEYAKTLYGITMQESGVSKLVSVKLEDN